MRKRILADISLCSGCRYCELVCSYHHYQKYNPKLSRIRVAKDDEKGMDAPLVCRQCRICIPAQKCPVDAIERNSSGAVIILETCTGCGECISACPFASVSWNPVEEKPLICNLCEGEPSCVRKCPTGALIYEDPIVMTQKKQRNRAFSYHKQLLTEWGLDGEKGEY
jgi:Fe-S-cluster-containing hydrogenase component 2